MGRHEIITTYELRETPRSTPIQEMIDAQRYSPWTVVRSEFSVPFMNVPFSASFFRTKSAIQNQNPQSLTVVPVPNGNSEVSFFCFDELLRWNQLMKIRRIRCADARIIIAISVSSTLIKITRKNWKHCNFYLWIRFFASFHFFSDAKKRETILGRLKLTPHSRNTTQQIISVSARKVWLSNLMTRDLYQVLKSLLPFPLK